MIFVSLDFRSYWFPFLFPISVSLSDFHLPIFVCLDFCFSISRFPFFDFRFSFLLIFVSLDCRSYWFPFLFPFFDFRFSFLLISDFRSYRFQIFVLIDFRFSFRFRFLFPIFVFRSSFLLIFVFPFSDFRFSISDFRSYWFPIFVLIDFRFSFLLIFVSLDFRSHRFPIFVLIDFCFSWFSFLLIFVFRFSSPTLSFSLSPTLSAYNLRQLHWFFPIVHWFSRERHREDAAGPPGRDAAPRQRKSSGTSILESSEAGGKDDSRCEEAESEGKRGRAGERGREGGQERDGESDGGRAGATELRVIPSFLNEDSGVAERSPGLIRVQKLSNSTNFIYYIYKILTIDLYIYIYIYP